MALESVGRDSEQQEVRTCCFLFGEGRTREKCAINLTIHGYALIIAACCREVLILLSAESDNPNAEKAETFLRAWMWEGVSKVTNFHGLN